MFSFIFNALFGSWGGKAEKFDSEADEPVKVAAYRVTHFHRDYYVLQRKNKRNRWENVTEVINVGSAPKRDHPILSEDFEKLVEVGKKFKENPASYDEHVEKNDELYESLLAESHAKRQNIVSKIEYI